jgi:predicted Abi (CAAX) family protease
VEESQEGDKIMSLFNVELPDNTAICPQCGVTYDVHGFHSCGSIDEAVKDAIAIRDTEWKLEYGKLVEQARNEIIARDKWWIEQMENLMKETTLRPLDITYSNYLIVKWEQFKQSLEEKDGCN